MLRIFPCALWPSVCLLWRNVYLDLLPFLWLGYVFCCCLFLFFDVELHELFVYFEINPLLFTSFVNIFSHSLGCLFILFMVSFAVQKFISLLRSHLFSFYFHYSRRKIKKDMLQFMSESVLPTFSSEFILSSLIVRSLIHFEFTFRYSVKESSNFILLHIAVKLSQDQLLKSVSFLQYIFLPPLS